MVKPLVAGTGDERIPATLRTPMTRAALLLAACREVGVEDGERGQISTLEQLNASLGLRVPASFAERLLLAGAS